MARISFMNTKIDNLTMDEAVDAVINLAINSKKAYVVTPNVSHIITLESDREFQKIYDDASLILTDGKPLIWISKLYKTPIKEKVSGSDLFPRVCKIAAAKGLSMFFLGAAPGVAKKAAENLKSKYEGLNIVGTFSPDKGFENDPEKLSEIYELINKANPDILIVALGAPKQEKFIYNHKDKMNFNVALCIGASLDFEAGNLKRAPKLISNMGLEWFYRFLKEPRRLFRRYFIEGPRIIPLAIKYKNKGKTI